MKLRIKSLSELKDKISMAEKLAKLIKSNKITEQQENTFLVLMDEIKEYKENKFPKS